MEVENIPLSNSFDLKNTVQLTPGFKLDEINSEDKIIDDLFDLNGKDNNYLYYKQHFVDTGDQIFFHYIDNFLNANFFFILLPFD